MNKLWKIQKEFNDKFFKDINKDISSLTTEEKIKETKEFILHLSREIYEILDLIPFKMHRRYNKFEILKSEITESLIDAQKFLLGLFQIWNVNYKEFEEVFIRKSFVVSQRYEQEKKIKEIFNYEKICILDIDGVLSDYPKCFIKYINNKIHSYFDSLSEVEEKLKLETLYSLKDDYRKSGYKRNIKVKDGAVSFVNKLKKNVYNIILLTARPYHKYSRIYHDTIYWLKKNKIKYDFILWDRKKDLSILNNFDLKNIKFVIEDNLNKANKISKLGVKVYLFNSSQDLGKIYKNVILIDNFDEVKI